MTGNRVRRPWLMVGLSLGCWLMLAGLAPAQPYPGTAATGDRCPPNSLGLSGHAPCDITQADLAMSPDKWPAPCFGPPCDDCRNDRSCCPRKDEFYILPPRTRWYGIADGGALSGVPQDSFTFATLNNSRTVALSTHNLNYDFGAFGHFLIGHNFNECIGVEVEFSGNTPTTNFLDIRDTTANSQGATGNLFSPFGGFGANPQAGLDYNSLAQLKVRNSLMVYELNVRRKIPMPPERLSGSIMIGVRYMDLPDLLEYYTESAVPVGTGSINWIQVRTRNQMVGPQIGGLLELYVDNRWFVTLDGRAALLDNRAQHWSSYSQTTGGVTTNYFQSRAENHTAFDGDATLTFVYRWSPNFITRLGYRASFVKDVALAQNNFANNITTFRQGPVQVNHTGTIIYHGPFAGIELAY